MAPIYRRHFIFVTVCVAILACFMSYASAQPVLPGDLDARNRGYVGAYGEAIRGFGSLKLESISVAMTGPQYRLLHQGDVDLCGRLSDLAGVPVETSSIALDGSPRMSLPSLSISSNSSTGLIEPDVRMASITRPGCAPM